MLKITERETDELIFIANCTDEDIWQHEATLIAKKELLKRNISQDQQQAILERLNKEADDFLKKESVRLKKNETESYETWEMVILFLFGPILFLRPYYFNSHTIFTLRNQNYYLKFKQRIIIFVVSFIAWYFYMNYTFEQSEKKRIEEIEKIDISDWEKLHGYD